MQKVQTEFTREVDAGEIDIADCRLRTPLTGVKDVALVPESTKQGMVPMQLMVYTCQPPASSEEVGFVAPLNLIDITF